MRLLDDERGQSVQVGAAILLGFVVIAVTIYQVQVVADQNAEVEFNHNQEVRQDLIDLRNSINNAGTQGTSDSVSVKLGGQYPPRTIFVNPPPIQGILRSQEAGNVSFGNVQVQGSYEGSGDPTELVTGNHTTNRIVYAPRYFELDDAGVTSIEHSLAFNAFENNATDPLTRERVVRGDSLTLTVVQGNLSEQGTRSVSLDPETVSGPTDSITITNDSAGPIDLYLPTETPSVWNETIGTSYGDNDARVVGFDGTRVHVELAKDEYELQMALVEVGDGVSGSDRYDVIDGSSGGGGTTDYTLFWQDPSGEDGTVEPCDANECIWNVTQDSDSSLTLTAETDPQLDGVSVDFAVNNSAVATVSGDGETTDGTKDAILTAQDINGTVEVYATADGGTDVIDVAVQYGPDGGGGPRAAYVDPSDGRLQTIDTSGAIQEYTSGQVQAIGPANTDLDGDSDDEVPYVSNNDNLVIIDADNQTQTLDDTGNVESAPVGVGDWDEDGTVEVLYIRDGVVWEADSSGTRDPIEYGCNKGDQQCDNLNALSVAGVGDFDGDGDTDVVYVGSNDEIRYFDGSNDETTGIAIGTGVAVSTLADFDGDSVLEMAHYDDNDEGIDLVESGGFDTSFDPSYQVVDTPMAAVDWDADGTPDIIHLDNSAQELHYLDPNDGSTVVITDGTGNTVVVSNNHGAR